MKKYDYLIVGAGLFGSIFAYEAKKRGKKVLVIEKRNHLGGNIYTKEIAGINVHYYGAHIFHTSKKEIWDYINQFAEFNNFINSPMANYNGQMYNLPFNMNTFSKLWNISKPEEAKRIIEEQKKKYQIKEPKNLEEQAISLVGYDVYEKLIKGYTEKQWGKSCDQLPPFIIKRLPVRFIYDNNYFNDIYQGIPKGGYTKIVKRMLAGIEVILNADYFAKQKKYDGLAKKILYTGAIDQFFNYEEGVLEYRSLEFEHQTLNKENFQGNAVINYTDFKTPYTRIIEHKHFEFKKSDNTVITYEYPKEWNKNLEPYYPINDDRNQEIYNKYYLRAKQLTTHIFGGRLAEYKYYDMDDIIEKALDLVAKELRESNLKEEENK
jgi:UDP-galactopyranose mutase